MKKEEKGEAIGFDRKERFKKRTGRKARGEKKEVKKGIRAKTPMQENVKLVEVIPPGGGENMTDGFPRMSDKGTPPQKT